MIESRCYFDLDYLPDEEMLDWVGRVVQRWWDKFNIKLPHDGKWYPFSRNAIEFIINYEPNDKTPRSVGNRLVDLWDKLKNAFSTTGKLFVESEFDAWRLTPTFSKPLKELVNSIIKNPKHVQKYLRYNDLVIHERILLKKDLDPIIIAEEIGNIDRKLVGNWNLKCLEILDEDKTFPIFIIKLLT